MKHTSIYEQLLTDEMYLENVAQWTKHPVIRVDLAFRLTASLITACLHQQLQTAIGKGLIYRTLERSILQRAADSDAGTGNTASFELCVAEGNRLLSALLPGKKSAIMSIVIHYTRLSFKQVDQLVGLCAYTLFTRLAFYQTSHQELVAALLPFNELAQFAPELTKKDYMAIGIYSHLSFFRTGPNFISI